jgi:hypothetical protein
MRRLVLLLILAISGLTADSARAQQLSAGVRGGLNVATSSVQGDLVTGDVGTRTGYHFGIIGKVDIAKNWALQTEVYYSQKGFGAGDGDVSLSVNYIDIPIYLVFQVPGTLSPHLYAGVYLGLESGCSLSSTTESNVKCEEATSFPSTKGADSGLSFGGGLGIDLGPGSPAPKGALPIGRAPFFLTKDPASPSLI